MKKSTVLRVLSSAIGTPFAVIFYLNIEKLAEAIGWDGFLVTGTKSMPNLAWATEPWAFALSSGVVGFAIGTWMHWLLSRFDRSKPSKPDIFRNLSSDITDLRSSYLDHFRENDGEYNLKKRNFPLEMRIASLFAEIEKLGIQVPDRNDFELWRVNVAIYGYLQAVEPFAERGQLNEARKVAKTVINDLKSAMSGNQLPANTEGKKPQ